MDTIRETLVELGYDLKDFGNSYRAKPIYRESSNTTSLQINKQTGRFVDYSANISGSFEELVKLSLNLKNITEAKTWISQKGINLERSIEKPKITSVKIYPHELLNELMPIHDYWKGRDISVETLLAFRGGLVYSGQMSGRYTFPIFNSKNQILGFAGRDIYNNCDRPKWKLIGDKGNWMYPFFINYPVIKQAKEVILVESIGDCLSLWDAGIKNTLVLFGVKLGKVRLQNLLKCDLKKIIIALNNDADKEVNTGKEASENIYKKLLNYYDVNQLEIKPPTKKDFGEMTLEEKIRWKNMQSYYE